MHIKRLHDMVEKLTECANSQLAKGTECVETHEMKEVACAIKELAEAEYYSKISKAMDEYEDESRRFYDNYRYENGRFAPKGRGTYRPRHYQMTPELYRETDFEEMYDMTRDMDRKNYGRMYYTENGTDNNRNANEGRSGMSRSRYFDTKMNHNTNSAEDKQAKMRDLEEYMRSLSDDITEMLADMSMDEKNTVKMKLQTLVTKIM